MKSTDKLEGWKRLQGAIMEPLTDSDIFITDQTQHPVVHLLYLVCLPTEPLPSTPMALEPTNEPPILSPASVLPVRSTPSTHLPPLGTDYVSGLMSSRYMT